MSFSRGQRDRSVGFEFHERLDFSFHPNAINIRCLPTALLALIRPYLKALAAEPEKARQLTWLASSGEPRFDDNALVRKCSHYSYHLTRRPAGLFKSELLAPIARSCDQARMSANSPILSKRGAVMGTVKWSKVVKGWDCIELNGGKRGVFIHISSVDRGIKSLCSGG